MSGHPWSEVDWDADDPFARCGGAGDGGGGGGDGGGGGTIAANSMSAEGERATLNALHALVSSLMEAIPTAATAAEASAFQDVDIEQELEVEEDWRWRMGLGGGGVCSFRCLGTV